MVSSSRDSYPIIAPTLAAAPEDGLFPCVKMVKRAQNNQEISTALIPRPILTAEKGNPHLSENHLLQTYFYFTGAISGTRKGAQQMRAHEKEVFLSDTISFVFLNA